MVDLLLVINTEEQLKVLTSSGMVKLGADLEVSVGPLGRNAQVGGRPASSHPPALRRPTSGWATTGFLKALMGSPSGLQMSARPFSRVPVGSCGESGESEVK